VGIRPGQHRSRLREREAELGELAATMAAARRGNGHAVFFTGRAGMGKSVLIEAARDMAADAAMLTLSARGEVMERDLPFAFAEEFLGDAGRGQPASPGDPLSRRAFVYDVARSRLREWARSAPLAILLDDMQWADPDSISLVAFLGRRLAGLPVALVGTMRPWPAAGLSMARSLAGEGTARVLDVSPLSAAATGEVVREVAGDSVPPDLIRRAFDVARGNPLLTRAVAHSIAREGSLPEPDVPALGGLRQVLLLSYLVGLPPPALECARAAAILGGRVRLAAVEAVAALSPDAFASGFDALVGAGILQPGGHGWAEFSHELLADALRDDMAPAQRRLLHARAFRYYAGLGDAAAAAPHALAADLSGDDRAVTVVAEAGVRALTRGAVQVALAQLAAAVELAGPAASAQLLLRQADALLAAGRTADALAAYQRLLGPGLRPLSHQMIRDVRAKMARAQAHTGRLDEALAVYDELVRDPGLPAGELVPLWLERAHVVWEKDGPAGAQAALEDLAAGGLQPGGGGGATLTAPSAPTGPLTPLGLAGSYFRLQAGDPAGLEDLKRGAAIAGQAAAGSPGQALPSLNAFPLYASACGMTERYEEGLQLTEQAAERLRSAGSPWSAIPLMITRLGILLYQGFPLRVVAGADDIEEEFGLDALMRPPLLAVKAWALAWLGRTGDAAGICDAVQRMRGGQSWFAALTLATVRGEILLARHRPADAAQVYADVEKLVARFGVGEPCVPAWAGGAVEAALAAGQREQAERVVAWLEDRDPALPCRWPRMTAVAGRAGIAAAAGDSDTADRLYREALAMPSARPLDRARIQLRYGTWLRRSQQPLRARAVLAEALQVAEERGAAGLAGQARAELSAAGGRRRRQHPAGELNPAGELTAQESRVVRLAITGATTREMAREMLVSVRTVETHLARAYRKLGVGSKAELRQRRAEFGLGG